MVNKEDLLSSLEYADSAVYQLGRMRDGLDAIRQALTSVQVLVCGDFHVFVLVHVLFQADGGGVGGCLPELQGLLLRVSILFFFLFSCSSFFFQADILLLVVGVLFSVT